MSNFVIAVEYNGWLGSEIRYFGVEDICELNDIITDDVGYNDMTESYYEALLNDSDPIKIGIHEYYRLGHVFRDIDPIAFNEAYLDYVNNEVEELEYEHDNSDMAIYESELMDLHITIIDKERVRAGGWIYGLKAEDFDRCTDNYIHYIYENFSELLDYLYTEEMEALMKAFGEHLDNSYTGIKIGENYFFASQILSEMDESEYNRMLDEWIITEAKEAVIDITGDVATIVIPFCAKYAVFKIRTEALNG